MLAFDFLSSTFSLLSLIPLCPLLLLVYPAFFLHPFLCLSSLSSHTHTFLSTCTHIHSLAYYTASTHTYCVPPPLHDHAPDHPTHYTLYPTHTHVPYIHIRAQIHTNTHHHNHHTYTQPPPHTSTKRCNFTKCYLILGPHLAVCRKPSKFYPE